LLAELKLAAEPLTSGDTPDRVQRLMKNGSPAVEATASGPITFTRSHDVVEPAVPVAESICQL